jgi:hypothetical protein
MRPLHRYPNVSVNSTSEMMPTYDGCDYYISPHSNVILVPCHSENPEPMINSCPLLIPDGDHTVKKAQLLVVYIIENTSDVGLILRHGDLLGANYTGPHAHIKAVRSSMLVGHYNKLLEEQIQYWADIEAAAEEYFNEEAIENDDLDDTVLLSLYKDDVMPTLTDLNIN